MWVKVGPLVFQCLGTHVAGHVTPGGKRTKTEILTRQSLTVAVMKRPWMPDRRPLTFKQPRGEDARARQLMFARDASVGLKFVPLFFR